MRVTLLPDLLRVVINLERDGIGFKDLTENIETTNTNGKLTFHSLSSLFERIDTAMPW